MECGRPRQRPPGKRTSVQRTTRARRPAQHKNASRPVSRVLYRLRGDDHSSGPCVAAWFSRPTRAQPADGSAACAARAPIRSCSGRGLPCRLPYGRRGGLLLHRFTLTLLRRGFGGRSVLCGAIPKITLGGRYPPPYPRGARTFLDCALSNVAVAAVRPTGVRTM